MSFKSAIKPFLDELLRILLGLSVVISLSVISIHIVGDVTSAQYTYVCAISLLFFSCCWFGYLLSSHKKLSVGHRTSSGFAVLFGALAFLVILPMGLDRSLTFFFLNEIEQAGEQGYSPEQMETLFIQKYTCEHSAVGKRMTEQSMIGNINITPAGQYVLTPRGLYLVKTMNALSTLFRVPRYAPEFYAHCTSTSSTTKAHHL